jgi:hypothetical protein
MKRSVAAAFVVLAVVLAPSAAGQVPAQDSVTGSATTGIGRAFTAFTFDVHSGPSGENPTGTVVFDTFFGRIGELGVTCLSVSGNRASMLVEAPPNTSGIVGVAVAVEDDGPGTDRIDFHVLSVLPGDCSLPSQVFEPTVFGDVTVVDAPPLPSSKDQCQNGGWRSYPGFKNQGDCLSFVATGGKNPPAGSP